jgi:hypothetical protein
VLLAPGALVSSTSGQCESGELHAPDGAPGDRLGSSVAISSAGTTALVGANRDDDQGTNSGAAYVFVLNGPLWQYQAKLIAADGASKDSFGFKVAVSSSGDVAIVASLHDDDAGEQSGAAYVFTRQGTAWDQGLKLVAADAAPLQEFGSAVAISADGMAVLVGARGDVGACPGDPKCVSGSAYMYQWDGSAWIEQSKLTASDASDGDNFGGAVALSNGGDVALVGAFRSNGQGSAYVFVREGTIWTQQAKLTATDGVLNDAFGAEVALSSDGNIALIGAELRNDSTGAAYLFARDGSTWSQVDELAAWDGSAQDRFGASVALGADGELAIVGAHFHDPCWPDCQDAGAAYLFAREGRQWMPQAKLLPATIVSLDAAGASVSASSAGERILVGARGLSSFLPGTAYVFDIDAPDCNENVLCDGREIAEGSASDRNGTGVPDVCEGDLDGDGTIGSTDFLILLALWGPCPQPPSLCPADLDNDDSVGITDFLTLLINWG